MEQQAVDSGGRQHSALAAATLVVAAAGVALAPGLRAGWPLLGVAGWLLVVALPWLSLALLRRRPRSAGRAAGLAIAVALALFALVVAVAHVLLGRGETRDRLAVTPMGGYSLVLSRVDCGPRCPTSVVLEQRWPLLPGVRRVREVGRWRPAGRASVSVAGRDTVWVTVPPYSPAQPSTAVEQQIGLDPSPF